MQRIFTPNKFIFYCLIAPLCAQTVLLQNTEVSVGFSPYGCIEEMISKQIDSSKKSIDVASYSFTSKRIAEKLIQAHKRGVCVRIILDKSQRKERYSVLSLLKNSQIDVRINDVYKIHHNKYMIFDGIHVQTGSYNYTKSAETRNAENAMILANAKELAIVYTKNFEKLWSESEKE